MSKMYCNYTQDEMNAITDAAKDYGMTPSGFQKYATLLLARQPVTGIQEKSELDIADLIAQMISAIEKKAPGETFVVSTVFLPEIWTQLNRSKKLTIGHALAQYEKTHPEIIRFTGMYIGSTKVYERIALRPVSLFNTASNEPLHEQ